LAEEGDKDLARIKLIGQQVQEFLLDIPPVFRMLFLITFK
jgi:hypothetical protein